MRITPTELCRRAACLERRGYISDKSEFCDNENAALLRYLATLTEKIGNAPWISFETLDEACEIGLVHGSTKDWLASAGKRVRLVVEE